MKCVKHIYTPGYKPRGVSFRNKRNDGIIDSLMCAIIGLLIYENNENVTLIKHEITQDKRINGHPILVKGWVRGIHVLAYKMSRDDETK